MKFNPTKLARQDSRRSSLRTTASISALLGVLSLLAFGCAAEAEEDDQANDEGIAPVNQEMLNTDIPQPVENLPAPDNNFVTPGPGDMTPPSDLPMDGDPNDAVPVVDDGGENDAACTPGGTGTMDVGTDSFLDLSTCLTWQKEDTMVGSVTNRSAALHCKNLTQDDLTWRLATAQELKTYPELPVANNAYLTGPVMIPATSEPSAGCKANSHSCNLTQYSSGNFACGWQGPGGGAYPVFCVSGSSEGAALDASFALATCCSNSSTYKEADCSDYQ